MQYRNKTIGGTNQKVYEAVKNYLKDKGQEYDSIPKSLDIYEKVLMKWKTKDPDEIKELITEMSVFHAELAVKVYKDINESMIALIHSTPLK